MDPNFCLDASGRFYEARGWKRQSQYISDVTDHKHVAIMIFGEFDKNEPTQKSKTALRAFYACAVDSGYLTPDFDVLGHDQDSMSPPQMCPGQALGRMIRRWPAP